MNWKTLSLLGSVISGLLAQGQGYAAGQLERKPGDCLIRPQPSLHSVLQDYRKGQFEKAFLGLIYFAKRNDAEAQVKLGEMYLTGNGIDVDELEAAYWIKKAAEQGIPQALYQLGIMYLDGVGVTQDDYLALEYVSQAASSNHAQAVHLYDYLLNSDFNIGC